MIINIPLEILKYGKSLIHQNIKNIVLKTFDVKIIDDPFSFLLESYLNITEISKETEERIVEVYLPLYSYREKVVKDKSGLNAWNAAPKSRINPKPRPLNEVYIPIPREFHKKHPDFFTKNIFEFEKARENFSGNKNDKLEVRFYFASSQ